MQGNVLISGDLGLFLEMGIQSQSLSWPRTIKVRRICVLKDGASWNLRSNGPMHLTLLSFLASVALEKNDN